MSLAASNLLSYLLHSSGSAGVPSEQGNFFARFIRELSTYSGFSLVLALLVAVAAVIYAMRHGLRTKPLPPASSVSSPGLWAWVAVAVLWVVVMLNYFDRQLLAVLNTSITSPEQGIPMSQEQFGLVTTAFLIVYAALSPVGGYLADRFSRKFIILCSLVVWSVVTWMTGKADSYNELLFWRGAMGVSEAFYIPAALALISDYHRGSTRSMATGLHMSGIYAGQILAGYGAWIASDPSTMLGWRLTFETFGFIGVAYALIVIFLLKDPEFSPTASPAAEDTVVELQPAVAPKASPTAEKSPSADFGVLHVLRSLFTGRAMALLLIMYAFAGFANWFLMNWYPRLLQDMFNISEADAGPKATFWINLAKYASVLLAAVVADLWYRRNKNDRVCVPGICYPAPTEKPLPPRRNARALVPGICYLVAGPCVILAMLPALGAPLSLGLSLTLALVATQGVAQGSLDATLMPVLRSHVDERFSATGYGLLNLTSVSAGAIISWLGGFLKDSGIALGVPLGIAGFLMIICGLLFFFLPKQPQSNLQIQDYTSEPSLIKGLFIVRFAGRMQRRKFWLSQLLLWSLSCALRFVGHGTIAALLFGGGEFSVPSMLLMITLFLMGGYLGLVGLGMQVRRLHDIGVSGWKFLLGIIIFIVVGCILPDLRMVLIILGSVIPVVLFCLNSQYGANRWGLNPKGQGNEQAVEAAEKYRLAVKQGDADAQYSLGLCHYYGNGVKINPTEAAKWWHCAAEQGHAKAQFKLGECYHYGNGVDKNHVEAVKWYRRAADNRHSGAMYRLAECYRDGIGVEKDEAQAKQWLRKAAECGHPSALNS